MKVGVESKHVAEFLHSTPIPTFPLRGGRGFLYSPSRGKEIVIIVNHVEMKLLSKINQSRL
jgi:hypothetical protein